MAPILTAKVGNNADLFPDVLELYCPDNGLVLDATWGKGVFWKKVTKAVRRISMDVLPLSGVQIVADARSLPFADAVFDMIIFDPPYMHAGGRTTIKKSLSDCYRNTETLALRAPRHKGLAELYLDVVRNSKRHLKKQGILVLKGMDELEGSDRQCLFMQDLINIDADFRIVDVFVLVRNSTPLMRHKYQHHARKNHSYFIVLRKK